ncbi:MAG TPA: CHAD domain-containing protein [Dermatophilaceae bacterium]|jgi:CHAD domain-containing protein
MTSAARALQAAGEGRLELQAMVAALSRRYTVVSGPKLLVGRVQLDTFDRRLRAVGLTLEHQRLATGELLVLRRPGAASAVAVPVTGLRWPALVEVLPTGPIREAVAPVTGVRALMVTSDEKRRMRRLELHNEDGKIVARVELDEPASAAGAPAQVTVRSLRGYDEDARRADRLLVGLGLQALDRPEDREPSSAPPKSDPSRAVPARLVLTKSLIDFLMTIRENLPGLLDDVDTEFLHDFRVAVRRTRATLKLGRPALPDAMRLEWEPAFRWLGDLTTPVRDLDVYELDLPVMSQWLVTADPADLEPLATHLRGRRTSERRVLVRSLRSARFRRLIMEWGEELARLVDGSSDADREPLLAGHLADRSIARAYRRVARGGALIGADSPAEDLHELRKRCKELRYALEVFTPLIDDAARKRAVDDLKELQDVLGRFQDSEVQRRALREFAEEMMADGTTAGAMLAMGELIGHLDVEQNRARREFDVAFARLVRPSARHLMHQIGGAT